MFKWVSQFSEAKFQTKFFVINALLFGALIIGSMIYCYARVEAVHKERSYDSKARLPQP
jgi:hypothetical protein